MSRTKDHWVDKPEALWEYSVEMDAAHQPRLALDRACLRLGYSRPMLGGVTLDRSTGYLVPQDGYEAFRDLGHSLTSEVVDAASAQVCRPLQVKVVPGDNDYELLHQCEDASEATNGILDANDFLTNTALRVAQDGMHCSVGFAKVAVDRASGELEVTRVDPLSMRWARDQGPDLYDILEVQAIPRRRLLTDYADDSAAIVAIKKAPSWTPPSVPGVEASIGNHRQSDCIKVVEAYAVKVGDVPGRHVIAIQGKVLEQEDYDHDCLPYAPYRWGWDFRGFEGVSLARIVAPYDVWTRELVRMHFEALKAGVPIIWKQEGETAFEGLTDVPYQIGTYNSPNPPTVGIAGTVNQDVVAQIAALRERAFAHAGVSIQQAQGQIPAGFKSAPSINAWSEVVNQRGQNRHQLYDQFYANVGKLVVRFAPDAYKGKKIRVKSGDAQYLKSVKFPNLNQNKVRVQVLMTSNLPRTFSGKLATIGELKTLGAIKPGTEARYLEEPALEAVNAEALAPRRLAESIIQAALNEGTWPRYGIPNIPELLLELLPLARAKYMDAQKNGTYLDDHVSCLHRIIRVTESMQAPPEMSLGPAMAPPPMGGPPMDPMMGPPPGMMPDPMMAPPPPSEMPLDPMAAPAMPIPV